MIDESGETVYVPFDSAGQRAISDLRYKGPSRDRMRALQPFGVSLPPWEMEQLRGQGAVEVVQEAINILVSTAHYSEQLGLCVQPDSGRAVIL